MDSDELLLHGVDISHRRLPQLLKLADAAEAFYHWVETKFRKTLNKSTTLSAILMTSNRDELILAITSCYAPIPHRAAYHSTLMISLNGLVG